MDVRKLLRTEIWSKRASRWILLGFCILLVGLFAWAELENDWLTPSERKAARTALVEMDSLQNSGGLTDQQYEEEEKRVEEKVQVAKKASWTFRDELIADGLGNTLKMNLLERKQKSDERLKELAAQDEGRTRAIHELHELENARLHAELK
jgi:hypothetical protein